MQIERKIPIHQATNRYNLLWGADREMMLTTGLLAFTLIFVSASSPSLQALPGIGFGVLVWLAGLVLLRMMAKADPLMRQVYIRHIRYRAYYPAHATPYRKNNRKC